MSIFKLMSFNIRGARAEDGANAWSNRAQLNIALIKRYAPHIIGFQELQAGNLAAYDQQLTEYDQELGPRVDHLDERYQQNAIFYNPERFERLDGGSFYLSETPEVFSKSWDSSIVRGANWVRLRDKSTGAELFYLNTHLDHRGEQARVEGSRLIVRRINELAGELPVAVTGDFNSRAWQPPGGVIHNHPLSPAGTVYRVYINAGFDDAYLLAGNSNSLDTNTFHGFKGEDFAKIGLRIDWILLRNGRRRFEVASCHILRDEDPPLYPSDHYPVLAELELR
jgi:endonuclease/exonuclease/phosphatase family metal-dependent hydrolase